MQNKPPRLNDPRFQLADGRTRPDFLFIGGAKCGSTSFAVYLGVHPQVIYHGPKEPNFWSWAKYPKKYQDFFVNESPLVQPGPIDQISGEFSTSYLLHPLSARRVHDALPGAKIIMMLRNPVDRAYSHFIMSKRAGLERDCSFEEIVEREIDELPALIESHQRCFSDPKGRIELCMSGLDGSAIQIASHQHRSKLKALTSEKELRDFYFQSYVFRSLYVEQLRRWVTLFPADQLLIMQSERFFDEPAIHMAKACEFFGLEKFDFAASAKLQKSWGGGASNAWKKSGNYSKMNDRTRSLLENFFRPWNVELSKLCGIGFDWE
ncbi:MAG: hypothetical protein ACI9CB_001141 [Rhodothermales bacterium]